MNRVGQLVWRARAGLDLGFRGGALRRHGLWMVVLSLALVFVLFGSGFDLDYVIPKRIERLTAIVIAGVCLALSSVIFQTLTANRILTPAVMGYESVFLLLHTLLLLLAGTPGLVKLGDQGEFWLSMFLMLSYSWALHQGLFMHGKNNVYTLLLLGLVLSTVVGTFTQFVQLRISPDEFAVLQGLSYTSFNRAHFEQLFYSALLLVAVALVLIRTLPVLDVLALGREQAISLGVNHRVCVRFYLALVSILVAVSTSLVGPTAFMGIFVANMAYSLAGSSRHKRTLPAACAVAIGSFLLAQLLVEHLFNYRTTVSILVNLVCGASFLFLVVRSKGRA